MIHDPPAARLQHQARGLLAAEKHRLQIHGVDEIPVLLRDLQRIEAREPRGIVHHAVQPAALRSRPRANIRPISATLSRLARNSGAPPHSSAVRRASSSDAMIVDRDPRAFLGQPQRNSPPDALRRARHQHHLALKLAAHHGPPPPPARRPALTGSGSRPVKCAHPQNSAVDELSAPATAPIVRGS